MGTRGDLLTLVDGAPGSLATLQGALTTWTHRELAAAVHRRAEALAIEATGDEAGIVPEALVTVAPLPVVEGGLPGWHDARTDHPADHDGDDHDGADHDGGDHDGGDGFGDSADLPGGPAAGDLRADLPASGDPETIVASYVAVALPDRWRVVGRGHLAVSDGRRSWVGTSTLVTERDSARAAIHDAGAIGACLYPGALLGGLELGTPEPGEIEGRACWVVDAQPRPDVSGTSLASTAAPHALRLHRDLVGVDHRIWFDTATGILLRHEGYVDGEICSWTSLTDLVFDSPLDDGEFRPPPGAVVRSRHELLRDHLSEMGIDPDTVDLDDPAQVRDALRQGG
jgi:hypothetical protein